MTAPFPCDEPSEESTCLKGRPTYESRGHQHGSLARLMQRKQELAVRSGSSAPRVIRQSFRVPPRLSRRCIEDWAPAILTARGLEGGAHHAQTAQKHLRVSRGMTAVPKGRTSSSCSAKRAVFTGMGLSPHSQVVRCVRHPTKAMGKVKSRCGSFFRYSGRVR